MEMMSVSLGEKKKFLFSEENVTFEISNEDIVILLKEPTAK